MAGSGILLPTAFRHLLPHEWAIVDKIFGPTLPSTVEVLIGNGVGAGGAPFTAPARVIWASMRMVSPVLSLAAAAASRGSRLLSTHGIGTGYAVAVSSYLNAASTGYVINVGATHGTGSASTPTYPDLTIDSWTRELLVHEMVHVWQGHNSEFAVSPTIGSLAAQCSGLVRSGGSGLSGRNAAYGYDLAVPPAPPIPWGSFNPEQQAQIVAHWYNNGMKTTGDPRFPYVRDYVWKGKVA